MGRNFPRELTNETEYPSPTGGRRCKRIKRTGERCKNWAAVGLDVCSFHGAGRKGSMTRTRRYMFKSETLTEMFERHANDPDKLDISEELALLRTILSTVTEKVTEFKAGNTASVILLAADIRQTALALSRIEKEMETSVTIEQIQVIADQFVSVIAQHIKDNTVLEAIQEDLFKVRIPSENGRFDAKGLR